MTDEPLARADRLASRGDLAGALAACDERDLGLAHLPETDGQRIGARLARADVLLRLLEVNEADAVASSVLTVAERHPDPLLLPKALSMLAAIALRRRELDRTESQAHRAQLLYAAAGAEAGVAQCVYLLAAAATQRGELGRGQLLLGAAIERFRALGDRGKEARCTLQLGHLEYERGAVADATATLERGRALAASEGLPLVELGAIEGLAWLALERGELDRARLWFEEVAGRYPPGRPALSLWTAQAHLARRAGDLDRAEQLLRAALAHTDERGPLAGLPLRLELASVDLDRGRPDLASERAEQLLEQALAGGLRSRIGSVAAMWMNAAARRQRADDWERAYRWAARMWRETSDTSASQADHLLAAGRAWSAADDSDAPARSARSYQLALWHARRIGRDDQVDEAVGALEAVAGFAPIPLAGFDLYEELGHGGFGVVWRAVRRADGASAAVKVLTRQAAREPRQVTAFVAEVRTALRVEHPYVAAVWEYGVADEAADRLSRGRIPEGSPFFAMELAGGGTLDPYCGTVPWRTAKVVLLGILRALACAHARDVLHRDVKPANVLLVGSDPAEGIRLADFGLSAPMVAALHANLHAGTPGYMAPEQHRGDWRSFGPWTDLYAVGCTAVALLTGEPPGPDGWTQGGPAPDGWSAWLRRALAPDPAERWRHAADAADALARLPDETEATPTAPRRPAKEVSPTFDLDEAVLASTPGPAPMRIPVPVPRRSEDPPSREASLGDGLSRPPPLLGRDVELAALASALAEAAEGRRARVVVVRGAPGIGKTLLVRRFGESVAEAGQARVLSAFVADSGDARARGGPVALIHRALRTHGLHGAALVERLTRCFEALQIEPDEVSLLVRTLGPLGSTVGGSDRAARHAATVRALQALAAERPVVAVLDDVGADASALSFARLLRDSEPGPVLLVLVTSEELPASLAPSAEVRVGPLPVEARERLLHHGFELAAAAAAQVDARAQGNPQLMLALVEDWRERGILVATPDGHALRPGVTPDLPEGLRGAWRSRVDSYVASQPPDAARALELLAVLGHSAPVARWRLACAEEGCEVTDEVVDRWARAGLVERTVDALRFEVAMFREALVDRSREAGRLPVHHAAAAFALAGEDLPEARGRHLLGAGAYREAAELLFQASLRDAAFDEPARILSLLDARDEAVRALGPVARDDDWGKATVRRAAALRFLDRADEAQAMLRDLLRSPTSPEREYQASGDLAHLTMQLGRPDEFLAAAALHVRVATKLDDPDRLASACVVHALATWQARDPAGCRALLETALTHATRPHVRARILAELADAHDQAGDSVEAERIAREAVAAAEGSEPGRLGPGAAWVALGNALRRRGELAEAEAAYLRAIDRYRTAGHSSYAAEIHLAMVVLSRGQLDAARADFARISRRMRVAGLDGYTVAARALWLAAGVLAATDAQWSEGIAAVRRELDVTRSADLDLALVFGEMARAAEGAGLDERARDLYAFERDQWTALGRPLEATRVSTLIERRGPPPSACP